MNGGEFLEPETMYSIMAWLFWVNQHVFLLLGLLQALLILLSCCLSIHPSCSAFLVAISKIVWFLLHLVVGMFVCHLLPVVVKIFFCCFGMPVCTVLPFVDIFLIFLLSLVLSGLFPQVVLLSFLVLPFPFRSYIFQHLYYYYYYYYNSFLCFSHQH